MHVRRPSVKTNGPAPPAESGGDAGINETSGSGTVQSDIAAAHDLPDLSRLSLGTSDGPAIRQPGDCAHAVPGGQPVVNVHVTVHTHGAPVTINVNSTPPPAAVAAGTNGRTIRRTGTHMMPPVPPPSPVRVRLRGRAPTPNVGPAQGAVTQAFGAPIDATFGTLPTLSPLLRGINTPAPLSPRLESVPGSPAPSLGSSIGSSIGSLEEPEVYEHIAPRDDAHTGKWYVVTAGRRVGIWRDWLQMQDFVTLVRGNAHKSFRSRAEAEAHYFDSKAAGRVWVIKP
ncbi:hypothetical protein K466DRAFT_667831 [Polyporus arcularius HHB13444]|uniref:Ribonuclease H1 N-terminal domain-containing protein n=1 Tax=Polyporus arcularius HHB13444 TaxID=1314778 RepID=A0A5C3NUT0_9APHY|nr:hypothetical protein K466DRAFT_667831 [Polyporus arcularius HHB13444]